jgi:FlaA1/EpsC-like NDP-sugar epimerase
MKFIAHDTPRTRWGGVALWLGDVIVAIAAMALADIIRRILPFGAPPDRYYVTPDVLLLVALIWSAVFYFLGAYQRRNRDEWRIEARTVFLATTFALLSLAAALYFIKIENFSRVLFVYFYVLDMLLTLAWRLGVRYLRTRYGGLRTAARRALIIGTDASAKELAAQLQGSRGFTLVGFIAESESSNRSGVTPIVGTLDDALKVVERILHNMSLLMDRSFTTVQELNRYRKEVAAVLAQSGNGPAPSAA